MPKTEERGGEPNADIADKGGWGVSQLLTITDKGGGGPDPPKYG